MIGQTCVRCTAERAVHVGAPACRSPPARGGAPDRRWAGRRGRVPSKFVGEKRSSMSMLIRLRRAPFVCVLLALAAVLASCGGPDVPLNGTVVDAYSGKPVSSATLDLGGSPLTTDASGRYQITSWSQRDTLKIAATGYEPLSVSLADKPELATPTPPAVTLDWQ